MPAIYSVDLHRRWEPQSVHSDIEPKDISTHLYAARRENNLPRLKLQYVLYPDYPIHWLRLYGQEGNMLSPQGQPDTLADVLELGNVDYIRN